MSSLPLISVITPSYNQGQFLEETMLSVLSQDYPRIEYIVIDGDSTDESVDIIRRYSNRLSYWVSERDNGQAEAINKGMTRATGDIVAWLNSDDIYLPGTLTEAAQELSSRPSAAMVYANGLKINESSAITSWPRSRQFSLLDLLCFNVIHQPTAFIRRSALKGVGFLDPNYHLLLDHHLWVRLARQYPVLHIDRYWAAARDHPTSKNTSRRADFGAEAFRLLQDLGQYPDIGELILSHNDKVTASAICFGAGYVLAAGNAHHALRKYLQATRLSSSVVGRYWMHIGLAVLSALNMHVLETPFRLLRRRMQVRPSVPSQALVGRPINSSNAQDLH